VPPEGNRRVAIIGGGLAGLTCAYALRRRGVDTVVFEAAPRAGGRSDAGIPYLLGVELFRNTFKLIDDLGLSSEILPIEPHAGQVYKGRIYHHRVASAAGILTFKGLNIADKALLPKMAYLTARYGSSLDFHQPERGSQLDDETVASFIKRELSQNILNYVAGPLISTLFFYSSEETSRLLYLLLARHMHNTRMSTLRGGLGRLIERLSGHAQVVHRLVETIAADGDSYLVNGDRFSTVVVAVNGDAVLRIEGIRRLVPDEDVEFFQDCRYQRVVTLVADTELPIDGSCYAVSIPRVERLTASTISFLDYIDPSRVPAGKGALVMTGGGESVSGSQLMTDLQKLYRIEPNSTRVIEWSSGMPKFPPGRYRQIRTFKERSRRPELYFCGDYLMGPFIEAAITTGLNAATEIQQRGV
jgi:protoporphyrinogen/coproporphyrinogen III oxidase